jgi:ribosomal protein S18 acetylase RimI-like enzyme
MNSANTFGTDSILRCPKHSVSTGILNHQPCPATVSLRPTHVIDKTFLRTLSDRVYYDLVLKQFHHWDANWQERHFEDKWRIGKWQVIALCTQAIGALWITEAPEFIKLHEIQILPEFQNKGIGTRLISEVLVKSTEEHKPVRLEVLKKNRAKELYLRLGFIVESETEAHFRMIYFSQG